MLITRLQEIRVYCLCHDSRASWASRVPPLDIARNLNLQFIQEHKFQQGDRVLAPWPASSTCPKISVDRGHDNWFMIQDKSHGSQFCRVKEVTDQNILFDCLKLSNSMVKNLFHSPIRSKKLNIGFIRCGRNEQFIRFDRYNVPYQKRDIDYKVASIRNKGKLIFITLIHKF